MSTATVVKSTVGPFASGLHRRAIPLCSPRQAFCEGSGRRPGKFPPDSEEFTAKEPSSLSAAALRWSSLAAARMRDGAICKEAQGAAKRQGQGRTSPLVETSSPSATNMWFCPRPSVARRRPPGHRPGCRCPLGSAGWRRRRRAGGEPLDQIARRSWRKLALHARAVNERRAQDGGSHSRPTRDRLEFLLCVQLARGVRVGGTGLSSSV